MSNMHQRRASRNKRVQPPLERFFGFDRQAQLTGVILEQKATITDEKGTWKGVGTQEPEAFVRDIDISDVADQLPVHCNCSHFIRRGSQNHGHHTVSMTCGVPACTYKKRRSAIANWPDEAEEAAADINLSSEARLARQSGEEESLTAVDEPASLAQTGPAPAKSRDTSHVTSSKEMEKRSPKRLAGRKRSFVVDSDDDGSPEIAPDSEEEWEQQGEAGLKPLVNRLRERTASHGVNFSEVMPNVSPSPRNALHSHSRDPSGSHIKEDVLNQLSPLQFLSQARVKVDVTGSSGNTKESSFVGSPSLEKGCHKGQKNQLLVSPLPSPGTTSQAEPTTQNDSCSGHVKVLAETPSPGPCSNLQMGERSSLEKCLNQQASDLKSGSEPSTSASAAKPSPIADSDDPPFFPSDDFEPPSFSLGLDTFSISKISSPPSCQANKDNNRGVEAALRERSANFCTPSNLAFAESEQPVSCCMKSPCKPSWVRHLEKKSAPFENEDELEPMEFRFERTWHGKAPDVHAQFSDEEEPDVTPVCPRVCPSPARHGLFPTDNSSFRAGDWGEDSIYSSQLIQEAGERRAGRSPAAGYGGEGAMERKLSRSYDDSLAYSSNSGIAQTQSGVDLPDQPRDLNYTGQRLSGKVSSHFTPDSGLRVAGSVDRHKGCINPASGNANTCAFIRKSPCSLNQGLSQRNGLRPSLSIGFESDDEEPGKNACQAVRPNKLQHKFDAAQTVHVARKQEGTDLLTNMFQVSNDPSEYGFKPTWSGGGASRAAEVETNSAQTETAGPSAGHDDIETFSSQEGSPGFELGRKSGKAANLKEGLRGVLMARQHTPVSEAVCKAAELSSRKGNRAEGNLPSELLQARGSNYRAEDYPCKFPEESLPHSMGSGIGRSLHGQVVGRERERESRSHIPSHSVGAKEPQNSRFSGNEHEHQQHSVHVRRYNSGKPSGGRGDIPTIHLYSDEDEPEYEEGKAEARSAAGYAGQGVGTPDQNGSEWGNSTDERAAGSREALEELLRLRLPHFQSVEQLEQEGSRDEERVYIDYRNQFGSPKGSTGDRGSSQHAVARQNGESSYRKPKAQSGVTELRGKWTHEEGRKLYINRNGKKYFGRIAYMESLRENPKKKVKRKKGGNTNGKTGSTKGRTAKTSGGTASTKRKAASTTGKMKKRPV